MKYILNHKIYKNNWVMNPLVGVKRTKIVKNELGHDESVFVTGVEKKDKTLVNPKHVDLYPYLETRSMLRGNIGTTRTILRQALNTYSLYSRKKNTHLNFEHALRLGLPILGTKIIARTHLENSKDIAAFNERQGASLLSKWLVESTRQSTKNLPFRAGKALGHEVFVTGNFKSTSSVLRKRSAFYNEIWDLYNLDDEEDTNTGSNSTANDMVKK